MLRASRPRCSFRPRLEILEDRTLPATRFVVPLDVPVDNLNTFHTASQAVNAVVTTAGDIIQVEPGSAPGLLFDSMSDANLTIQGNPAFAVSELPTLALAGSFDVNIAGLTLKHLPLRISLGTLTFNVNGVITDCHITSDLNNTAIHFNGTTAASLLDSRIIANAAGSTSQGVVEVTPATGAANRIEGNDLSITSSTQVPLLIYQGANTVSDVVRNNRFLGNSSPIVSFQDGISGVTFRNNLVSSPIFAFGVTVNPGSQNIQIIDNQIDVALGAAMVVDAGTVPGVTTSVVIARNRLNTSGAGTGIDFFALQGSLIARVEGNDFHSHAIGVRVSAAAVANIDLGGGTQGSLGANNFRGFVTSATATSGAIVVTSPSGQTLVANNNLFHNTAITTPDDVFFDFNDNPARADVQASGSLSTNQSFVQNLFIRFLKRIGDVNNPNDAGAWVNALTNGATANQVATGIIRSPEALGHKVDELYRRFLARDADPTGRANSVTELQNGGTLENLIRRLVSSAEYALRFASNAAFVHSLFVNLLGRVPSAADLAARVTAVESAGRSSVANGFLVSVEFRRREVNKLFVDLLHRTPSLAAIDSFVNTGLDLLTLTVFIARSPEYQTNG